MEGNKILDLSNLSDEHFESVQKAVYRCMGSDGPGSFAFATHNECDALMATLSKALTNEFNKGIVCGAAALLLGAGIRYMVDKAYQKISDKKEKLSE